MDQKLADNLYHNIIKENYLGRIKQLIQLKLSAFKKEKIRHSQEELERKDNKLQTIEEYLRLTDEINRLTKELTRIRNSYMELLSLKGDDPESNRCIIQRARSSSAKRSASRKVASQTSKPKSTG